MDFEEWGREAVIPVVMLRRDETTFDHATEYQRQLKYQWLNRQEARGFDPRLYGRPIVIKRANGKYVVLDGANRIELAARAGKTEVPVLLYEGLTFNEEIELFRRFNRDRSNVNAAEIFHTDCLAGDLIANALDEMLVRNGLNARPALDAQRPGTMRWSAVEALKLVHTSAQELVEELNLPLDAVELTERPIKAYQAAWPGETAAPNSWLFKGIADWILNPRVTGKLAYKQGIGERDMRCNPMAWQEAKRQMRLVYGSPISLLTDAKSLHPNDHPGGSSFGPVGKYLRSSKFINALKKIQPQ